MAGLGRPPEEQTQMTDAIPSATGLTRRHALGAAAMVGVAVPTLAACSGDGDGVATDPETTGGSTSTSSTPTTSAPAGALATKADIPVGGGVVFADAGVVITQPEAGTFHGFTIVCTHQGCQVNAVTDTIDCPCHGSKYSIEDGSVVAGPAPAPLTDVPLDIQGNDINKA